MLNDNDNHNNTNYYDNQFDALFGNYFGTVEKETSSANTNSNSNSNNNNNNNNNNDTTVKSKPKRKWKTLHDDQNQSDALNEIDLKTLFEDADQASMRIDGGVAWNVRKNPKSKAIVERKTIDDDDDDDGEKLISHYSQGQSSEAFHKSQVRKRKSNLNDNTVINADQNDANNNNNNNNNNSTESIITRKLTVDEKLLDNYIDLISNVWCYYSNKLNGKVWSDIMKKEHLCTRACTYESFKIAIYYRNLDMDKNKDQSINQQALLQTTEQCDTFYHVHTKHCHFNPSIVATTTTKTLDPNATNSAGRGRGRGRPPLSSKTDVPEHNKRDLLVEPVIVYACEQSGVIHLCGPYCNKTYIIKTIEGMVCEISGLRINEVNVSTGFPSHGGFSTYKSKSISTEKLVNTIRGKALSVTSKFISEDQCYAQNMIKTYGKITGNALVAQEPSHHWFQTSYAFDAIKKLLKTNACMENDTGTIVCETVFRYAKLVIWKLLFSSMRVHMDTEEAVKGAINGVEGIEKYVKSTSKTSNVVLFMPEMTRIFRTNSVVKSPSPFDAIRVMLSLEHKERLVDYYAALCTQMYAYCSMIDKWDMPSNSNNNNNNNTTTTSTNDYYSNNQRSNKSKPTGKPSKRKSITMDKVPHGNISEFIIAVLYKLAFGGVKTTASNISNIIHQNRTSMSREQTEIFDSHLKSLGILPGSADDPRSYRDPFDDIYVLPSEPLLEELLPKSSTITKYGYSSDKYNFYSQYIMDAIGKVKTKTSVTIIKLATVITENLLSKDPDKKSVAQLLEESYV